MLTNKISAKLKGEYFYYQFNDNLYLILSLIKINDFYTFESFVVYYDKSFINSNDEVEIVDIYWIK